MDMMPAATDALKEAPVDATVRAANALGGVAPWSIDATRIASIIRATVGGGNSPVKIRYTAAPKETRPISSAMSCPRTATRLGSMRVIDVFQTAFLSVSLIRLCPFILLR